MKRAGSPTNPSSKQASQTAPFTRQGPLQVNKAWEEPGNKTSLVQQGQPLPPARGEETWASPCPLRPRLPTQPYRGWSFTQPGTHPGPGSGEKAQARAAGGWQLGDHPPPSRAFCPGGGPAERNWGNSLTTIVNYPSQGHSCGEKGEQGMEEECGILCGKIREGEGGSSQAGCQHSRERPEGRQGGKDIFAS